MERDGLTGGVGWHGSHWELNENTNCYALKNNSMIPSMRSRTLLRRNEDEKGILLFSLLAFYYMIHSYIYIYKYQMLKAVIRFQHNLTSNTNRIWQITEKA